MRTVIVMLLSVICTAGMVFLFPAADHSISGIEYKIRISWIVCAILSMILNKLID